MSTASRSNSNRPSAGQKDQPAGELHDVDATNQLAAAEMRALRKALLRPEQRRLDELRSEIDSKTLDAEQVSNALPEALRIAAQRGTDLAEPLGPFMPDAVRDAIRKNPEDVAETLSPVIGPTIRVAIAQALRGMVQSMNQIIDSSFSVQGLKWRIEGWRTGKSFGEIAMLNTLVYRVEQVFFIHKDSGLPLLRVVADHLVADDETMVAGMLTAIQDFVNESFARTDSGELATLEFGESQIWIELGPAATLAAVIRGNAPLEFRERMEETLEQAHLRHGGDLDTHAHDVNRFEVFRPALEELLISQQSPPRTKSPFARVAIGLFWIALVGLVAAGVYWGISKSIARQRLKDARQLIAPPPTVQLEAVDGKIVAKGTASRGWLRRTSEITGDRIDISGVSDRDTAVYDRLALIDQLPGVVINHVDINPNGEVTVNALRDRYAQPIDEAHVAAETQRVISWRWNRYVSSEASLIERRLENALEIPAGVRLLIDDGNIVATGTATPEWIAMARRVAIAVPGVERVDFTQVADSLDRYRKIVVRLESEPGLVVVDHGPTADGYRIRGLRDELARPVEEVLPNARAIGDVVTSWESFHSMEPLIVQRRAKIAMNPPESVLVDIRDGVATVSGRARHAWIESVRSRSIPGLIRIDLTAVTDVDQSEMAQTVRQLDGYLLPMTPNGVDFTDDQAVIGFVNLLKSLERTSRILNMSARLRITGAARGGDDLLPLAQQRVDVAKQVLEREKFKRIGFEYRAVATENSQPGIRIQLIKNAFSNESR